MAEPNPFRDPIIPVSEIVASFRSVNPEGRSEVEYEETFVQAVRQTNKRVLQAIDRRLAIRVPDPRDGNPQTGNEAADRLALAILPALQETFKRLTRVTDPSTLTTSSSSWSEEILDNLVDIDGHVEQIVLSITLISRSRKLERNEEPILQYYLASFRGKKIEEQTLEFLMYTFRFSILAFKSFVEGLKPSDLSTDGDPTTRKWENFAKKGSSSIDHLDRIIELIQKPLISVVKSDWQEQVKHLGDNLISLLEHLNPSSHRPSRAALLECCTVLEKYLDSLLASKDSRVDHEVVKNARQVLQSWRIMFLRATGNMIEITGSQIPWPANDDYHDIMDGRWEQRERFGVFLLSDDDEPDEEDDQMAEQSPIEPVADTIASFRTTDQNEKSEPEYKAIFRKAIGQIYQRVATHKKRTLSSRMLRTPISANPYDLSLTGAAVANKMACGVLPALREKIRLLPSAMNPSSTRSAGYRQDLILSETIVIMTTLLSCWVVVVCYWESILASNDPPVGQEAIADACQWLKTFRSVWLCATGNMTEVADQSAEADFWDELDTDNDEGEFSFDEDEEDDEDGEGGFNEEEDSDSEGGSEDMAEQAPMETVARTIAAFRSTNPNGKLEQDYQVIFRQAIRQLFQRLLTHRRRTLSSPTIRTPNEASQTGAAIANKMARVFLPALREKLRQLPAAMHPSSMRSGSSTWFEAILDNLIEIDKLLAEIDSSIITIWRTWNPRQGQERTAHQLSSYRGKMDTYRIEELLAGPICQLLILFESVIRKPHNYPEVEHCFHTHQYINRKPRSLNTIFAKTFDSRGLA
ncbi:hypothetical protein PSTT_09354, partial [Puccinia striiformis]